MFSLHILYFTLVFSFPSVLATPIVKQYFWSARTSNYISPCGIPGHTFPQQLLTGCLCTKYFISTVPPAVYKITNDNIFEKTRLLLPSLNFHYTQGSLSDVFNRNRLWPTEHFRKSPPQQQEGSISHHNHIKKDQKHISSPLARSFPNSPQQKGQRPTSAPCGDDHKSEGSISK